MPAAPVKISLTDLTDKIKLPFQTRIGVVTFILFVTWPPKFGPVLMSGLGPLAGVQFMAGN